MFRVERRRHSVWTSWSRAIVSSLRCTDGAYIHDSRARARALLNPRESSRFLTQSSQRCRWRSFLFRIRRARSCASIVDQRARLDSTRESTRLHDVLMTILHCRAVGCVVDPSRTLDVDASPSSSVEARRRRRVSSRFSPILYRRPSRFVNLIYFERRISFHRILIRRAEPSFCSAQTRPERAPRGYQGKRIVSRRSQAPPHARLLVARCFHRRFETKTRASGVVD